MTIEILAFLTLAIIGLTALAVYRDYRRDKAIEQSARELAKDSAEFAALSAKAKSITINGTEYLAGGLFSAKGMDYIFSHKETHYINTDELGMQSAAYAEYEDAPPFITEALDTELAENEELPDWARRWLEESEDGE